MRPTSAGPSSRICSIESRYPELGHSALLLAAIAGLWLAADGRLTSDEPSYLYVAAYQEVPQIIAGDVQPSGIPGFLQGRILHLLFAKGVIAVFGAGETGVRVFASIHLAIMVLNLLLIGRILRALLPTLTLRRAALAMVAMTPIVLYSSLKTLADNEALLAALIATYGLIRVAQGASAWWSAAAVAGLAVAALTKNQMAFLPAAFWIAVCLVPIAGVERRRLMAFGALSGIASFLLTLAVLQALGIELSTYLASYKYPFANATPLLARRRTGRLWDRRRASIGEDMRPEHIVQRIEHLGDAQIADVVHRGDELAPEVAKHVLPVELAGGDEVELLLEVGGEVVFDVAAEEAFEEGGDQPALVLGHEPLLVDPDIFAVAQHVEGRGIGGRPADAELLHLLDQGRFAYSAAAAR